MMWHDAVLKIGGVEIGGVFSVSYDSRDRVELVPEYPVTRTVTATVVIEDGPARRLMDDLSVLGVAARFPDWNRVRRLRYHNRKARSARRYILEVLRRERKACPRWYVPLEGEEPIKPFLAVPR